ncbi:MAG: phosphoenolpyruvate carboxykinase [Acidobacteria bacterium]|nr:phosphoenolpyruvate carboxykinase [Acidobacteriota bacterium]
MDPRPVKAPSQSGWNPSSFGLDKQGIKVQHAYWNLSAGEIYEHVMRRNEGQVAHLGPLVVNTGQHTGRSPNDKFIVREASSEKHVWWGKVNREISAENFERIYQKVLAHIAQREMYVQDCFAGAAPEYRVPIRVVTEYAWHSLFARHMFVRPDWETQASHHTPEFTVINTPSLMADPATDGTTSGTFILMNFARKVILIGGTSYAGETKKSIFTLLNYLLPLRNTLSMHCSANIGKGGDTAIFFGLSGTGKTTLSADPERRLIGDDEHGWSDTGVFNFEGGCYAKVINLSPEAEPDIYACTRRFGTVLENVVMDQTTRRLDLDSNALTENTRAAYPISYIPNYEPSGQGGHPSNIIMLTADAFGVLPPIAKLTPEQAMYHFISGYTAKVAGTEKGLGKEPSATFSTCFGAPFMVHHPGVYAELLRERIAKHNATCWLVNTGWSGGPYGEGQRMKIAYTRAMVRAALDGSLNQVATEADPIFGVHVPVSCPGVPNEVLKPRNTWRDAAAYDAKANHLAGLFQKNFKQFEAGVSDAVKAAGPKTE